MFSFLKKQNKIKPKLVLTGTQMALSFTIFLVQRKTQKYYLTLDDLKYFDLDCNVYRWGSW